MFGFKKSVEKESQSLTTKELNKKLITSVVSCGICLFILAFSMLAGVSTAWFANSKYSTVNDNRLSVKSDVGLVSATVIKYNQDDTKVYATALNPYTLLTDADQIAIDNAQRAYDQAEESEKEQKQAELNEIINNAIQPLAINKYDMVFTENRVYTPLILKLGLTNVTENAIKISFMCNNDTLRENEKLVDMLSNVIEIRCSASNELDDLSTANLDTYYDQLKLNLGYTGVIDGTVNDDMAGKTWKGRTFVPYTVDGANNVTIAQDATKSQVIEFTLDVSDVEKQIVFDEVVGAYQEVLYLYVYFDYNVALVEEYFFEKNGKEITTDSFSRDTDIDFIKDIVSISVSNSASVA